MCSFPTIALGENQFLDLITTKIKETELQIIVRPFGAVST